MPASRDRGALRAAVLCVAGCYALLMVGASFVDDHAPTEPRPASHCAICATSHSPQVVAEPDTLAHDDPSDAGEPIRLRHLSFDALLPALTTGRSPPVSAFNLPLRRSA